MDFSGVFEGRLSLVCVGNELNGDDALGYHLAYRLSDIKDKDMQVLYTFTVPEKFIGEVVDFKPERVVLIDAGDFKGRPGDVRVLDGDALEGFHVSTHRMPLKHFKGILNKDGFDVVFIGVQVKQIDVGSPMSAEVEDALDVLYQNIVKTRVSH